MVSAEHVRLNVKENNVPVVSGKLFLGVLLSLLVVVHGTGPFARGIFEGFEPKTFDSLLSIFKSFRRGEGEEESKDIRPLDTHI